MESSNFIYFGIIIALAVAVIYLGYSVVSTSPMPPTQNENNGNTHSGYIDLNLSSIKIQNLLDNSLEDITHNSTVVLKKDVPILLRANYTNPNKDAHEYTLFIKVVQKDTGAEQVVSTLVGKIGGDNGTFELSTKWQPTELGDYTLSLFALKSSDTKATPTFGLGTSTSVNQTDVDVSEAYMVNVI